MHVCVYTNKIHDFRISLSSSKIIGVHRHMLKLKTVLYEYIESENTSSVEWGYECIIWSSNMLLDIPQCKKESVPVSTNAHKYIVVDTHCRPIKSVS